MRRPARRSRRAFQVGDQVRFKIGDRDVVGTVVEDRGLIGAGSRRILRVEVFVDIIYVVIYEVFDDELQTLSA